MRSIKRIVRNCVLVIIALCLFESLIEFLYEPYTYTARSLQRDLQQWKGKIETLYCGTSLMQHGVNVEVADEEMGTVGMCIASSVQPMEGTYHLVKESVKDNPVKTIFISASIDLMTKEDGNVRWKGLVYDSLSTVSGKCGYLLSGAKINDLPYLLLPSVRTEKFTDFDLILDNIRVKTSKGYEKGAIWDKRYLGRGNYARKRSNKELGKTLIEKQEPVFSEESIVKEQETYLRKTIEYAKENDIEVILIYIPLTAEKIETYGDYGWVHEYFQDIARQQEIEFWDFNYLKTLKETYTWENFEDTKHLNIRGGERFAKDLAQVYRTYKNGNDISAFFEEECPYYK